MADGLEQLSEKKQEEDPLLNNAISVKSARRARLRVFLLVILVLVVVLVCAVTVSVVLLTVNTKPSSDHVTTSVWGDTINHNGKLVRVAEWLNQNLKADNIRDNLK